MVAFPINLNVPIANLLLDPQNPRLPPRARKDDATMLDYIARETSIDDLIESIARNGYFSSEPVVVFPAKPTKNPTDKTQFYVAEGNRRLSALRLLHKPSLYPRRKRIAEIAKSALHKPNVVPVIVYEKRQDTLPLLGYRHITGIKQWEPLAKSRYMAQLVGEFAKNEPADIAYPHVAEMVGSKPHYVRRALNSLAAFDLIAKNGFFDIEDLDEDNLDFSVLLTAVAYGGIRSFLVDAIPAEEPKAKDDLFARPKAIKAERLEELTRWLFEKGPNGSTKIGESRNIQKLNVIVVDQKALARFREGASIDFAFRLTRGAIEEFAAALYAAEEALSQANSLVAHVDEASSYADQVGVIFKQADILRATIKR